LLPVFLSTSTPLSSLPIVINHISCHH
jgi:hypothetical protein